MKRLVLDQDVKPLSEFRSNAALLLEHVRTTKRPLVITQHGRSAAVLLDVKEYEKLMDKIDLLQEIFARRKNRSMTGKASAIKPPSNRR
jgi:prevent-host-death family protein